MNAESEAIEKEFRLAKEYWQQTIQPHIAGRRLRDVELYVAEHAYNRLRTAAQRAEVWNNTDAGRLSPCSAGLLAEVQGDDFHAPERLFAEETLKPESLAMIAGPLMKKHKANPTPAEAVRIAHGLLIAAEDYVKSLPKQGTARTRMSKRFDSAFSIVTFTEIAASNRKDSRCLPLLPTIQKGRNEGQLSLTAFKRAVEQYLEQKTPRITEEEFKSDAEQNKLLAAEGKLWSIGGGKPLTYQELQCGHKEYRNTCLQNGQIRVQDLCHMRWERFKQFWEHQQSRAAKRQPPEPKTKSATSTSSSQIHARKRGQ